MNILKYLTIILLVTFVGIGQAYSQSEATLLAEKDYKTHDAELNRVYRQVLAKLTDKRSKSDFEKAQKNWLNFRDAEAQFRAGVTAQGGSAYSTDCMTNLAELTEERTKQMKMILKSF